MLRHITFTLILVVMFSVFSAFGQTPSATPSVNEPPKANVRPSPKPEELKAEPFDRSDVKTLASKCVTLETEAGNIILEMYPESAPGSVRNFLNLAATGALDTTTFSRVVPGFVIQGGNIWTRVGGVSRELGQRARRRVPDEPNKILHERGIISMARTQEPDAATTHFFILVSAGPNLDGSFAAFGRVTQGMSVVDAINKAPVENEVPVKPVRINKATVSACTANPLPTIPAETPLKRAL